MRKPSDIFPSKRASRTWNTSDEIDRLLGQGWTLAAIQDAFEAEDRSTHYEQ